MQSLEEDAEKQISNLRREILSREGENGWNEIVDVLNQIQSEIDEGRPKLQRVSVRENLGGDRVSGSSQRTQSTSVNMVVSEEYPAVEALDMTAEALALAFISPTKMASKVFDTVERFRDNEKSPEQETIVQFADPRFPEKKSSTLVSQDILESSEKVLQPLASSLDKLVRSLEKKNRSIAFETESDANAD